MSREILFQAIGHVEDEMLLDTEWSVHTPRKTVARRILIAAAILMMLVTAVLAAGALLYNSPEEMLKALFGNQTGYDALGTPAEEPGLYWVYAFERVPVDEAVVMEDMAPYVQPVGEQIRWKGYTLTVDSFVYDAPTHSGFVTWTLENPDGLPDYRVIPDGSLNFDSHGTQSLGDGSVLVSKFGSYHFVEMSELEKTFVIQEKTTETRIACVSYFCVEDGFTAQIEISMKLWLGNDYSAYLRDLACITAEDYGRVLDQWESAERCPDVIRLDLSKAAQLPAVTAYDGDIWITPVSMRIDRKNMAFWDGNTAATSGAAHSEDYEERIRFRDGSTYVLWDREVSNCVFRVSGIPDTESFLTFNRIIDIHQVTSVCVDGYEFLIDE